MQNLSRLVLRSALLWRASVETTTLVPAACSRVLSSSLVNRNWFSSSPNSEEALRKAERMVELMGQSTQLQQIMMNVLPGPLRNPDVFKQLFGDPATRRRIAEIIAARGISIPDHLLERMSPTAMDDTFARASRLGLDPGQLFTRLMAHPGLLAKLQQPRVMAAFLDISEDPSRQAKYESDKELLEVVHKVRDIMGTAKPRTEPDGQPSSPQVTTSDAGITEAEGVNSARMPPPPGHPPHSAGADMSDCRSNNGMVELNPLAALLASDSKTAKWLDNPQVMAALGEVHKSPWKTVKYVFNRDVMEAFKDLKELMQGKKA